LNFKKLLILFLLLNSCGLKKRFVYLNNGEKKSVVAESKYSSAIIQVGDRVEIKIAGLDPESSLPFYFSGGAGIGQESPSNTFLVDSKGEVAIPILGKVELAGFNREEAEKLLTEKLKDLIKVPVVQIRIFNFMITVLGEVKSPGYIKIGNNKANLLEVLAMAGDLTMNADRKKIIIWREENNERKEYIVDLTSTSIFNSPVFLVKQNDLIYVRPNKTGLIQPTLFRTTGPMAMSVVSLILSTMLFFYR